MANCAPTFFHLPVREGSFAVCEIEAGGLVAPCVPGDFVRVEESVGKFHAGAW